MEREGEGERGRERDGGGEGWTIFIVVMLTFPSSVGDVIFRRKSLSLGSVANSESSRRTLVRGGEVMST